MIITGRLKFNGVDIGNHGVVNTSYSGNVQTVIIPRALGVKVWSTEDLGGGILTLKIDAVYGARSIIDGEDYCANIHALLSAESSGTLTITSEGSTVSLTNVYIQSIESSNEKTHFKLSISAIKSAY